MKEWGRVGTLGRMAAFALLGFSLLVSVAHAEGTANFLLQEHASGTPIKRQLIEIKVESIENGYSWSNTYLQEVRHEQPFYCVPDKFVATGPQIIDMLRRGVDGDPEIGKQAFGLAILSVMQSVFPCKP
jgi:hypothetical protein